MTEKKLNVPLEIVVPSKFSNLTISEIEKIIEGGANNNSTIVEVSKKKNAQEQRTPVKKKK